MVIFIIIAAGMAVMHLAAGWERPRLAVFVSAALWLLYAYYEFLVATGVLCEADCNIRVDLVFFIPILALATFCAYQSYMGRPGQAKIILIVLGIVGLVVVGVMAESSGFGRVAHAAIILCALAFGVYVLKSRLKRNRP